MAPPPREAPAQVAGPAPVAAPPPARTRVELAAPGWPVDALEREVVVPLEQALAGLPGVRRLAARADEGAAELLLEGPVELAAVQTALTAARSTLPADLAPPILRREGEGPVALLRLRSDRGLPSPSEVIARVPGVARVEVCGGADEVIAVELDAARLGGVALDAVVRALEGPPGGELVLQRARSVEALTGLELPGGRRLADLATVSLRPRPTACRDHGGEGGVTVLVSPQRGADRAELLAALRAVDFGPAVQRELLPDAEEPGLAAIEVELTPGEDAVRGLAVCLGAAPGAPRWALVGPGRPVDASARLRLFVAGAPALTVRDALSACAPVRQASMVGPPEVADLALSIRVFGPDPAALAATAELAVAALAVVPEVTWTAVLAARPRTSVDLELDREALAARGVAAAQVAALARLAAGPLELPGTPPLVVDVLPRTGSIAQDLAGLFIQTPAGPTPLSALVRATARETLAPRYRVDRQAAALIAIRLRRSGDRQRVQDELAQTLRLPVGVRVEFDDAAPW